jgi:DNA repair photolyase
VQKKIPMTYPIITRLKNLDFWYWCRYYIDIYRECPYGCEYCNTRKKSHFSGLTFIRGIPEEKGTIGLGLISDVYSWRDQENETVHEILELLDRGGYGLNIVTKSDRITDDSDVLIRFAQMDRIRVTFTILTLDGQLSRALEGRSPAPEQRLNALRRLRDEGIPAGVALSPIIPCINDDERALRSLIEACRDAGAQWVLFSGFSVVPRFFQNPLWEEAARIHRDTQQLRKRYEKTKKFLVPLLKKDGLPIRIPRITFTLYNKKRTTQKVSEFLFNISYLYELLEDDVRMMRYRRAAYMIEKVNTSLATIISNRELGYIKGVNPEIEKVIEEVVLSGDSSLYRDLSRDMYSEVHTLT